MQILTFQSIKNDHRRPHTSANILKLYDENIVLLNIQKSWTNFLVISR